MQPIERQVSDEIPRRYVNLCDWPIIIFGNFISNRVKGYDFYDNGQVVLKGLTAARVLILEPVPIVMAVSQTVAVLAPPPSSPRNARVPGVAFFQAGASASAA